VDYEKYSAIVRDAAYSVIKTALITKAVSLFPPLAKFNKLLDYVTGKIARFLVDETDMRIFFAYTDFRVSRQASSFITASELHHQIQLDPNATLGEKQRAEKILIDSFRTFAKLR
jgi:hypothetical protein